MLILKQNAANTVPTPPSGKGTIFLDDSDTLSVKTSDGNVETFPTVAASNAQVVFINGTSLSGESDFVYDFNTNQLNLTGNVAAGNVLTNNLLYANGTPWDLSDPGGSNTQIQFNDDESFGGSAAFTFNKGTNAVSMTGNVTVGNLSGGQGNLTSLGVTNDITAGNVLANSGLIVGNLIQGTLTTSAQPNITSVGSLSSLTVVGNASTGNVSATTGTFTDISGTLTTAAQPNITSVGTLGSLTVSGNASAGNLSTAGALSVTGNANVGNLGATGVVATTLGGTLTTASQPNITSVGTLSSLTVTGNGSFGNVSATGGNLTTLGVTGDITAGNVLANSGLLVGNLIQGTLTTSAQPNITSVGSLSSLTVVGNGGFGNISATSATFSDMSGALTTAAQPNVTSVGTLTGLDVNGNIIAANITANTGVFTGNGSGLSALAGANVTGTVANATHSSTANTVVDAAQPNITSVGTLTSLSVTGNVTAGNVSGTLLAGTLETAAQPNVTSVGTLSSLTVDGANITLANGVYVGNGSGLTAIAGANVTGTVANATHSSTANTVVDAAQPNITSVGTLTSLAVTGNVSAGNVSGTLLSGTLATAAQPNITSVGTLTGLLVDGSNITLANGVFVGNGVGLFSIAGANVTGTVANATHSSTANTVVDAAQGNITSLGTLTGLSVDGSNITLANGVYVGNGSGLTAIAGANVTGTVANATHSSTANTVTTAAQPNITSVGTLTSLSVTGNVSAGNVSGTLLAGTLETAAQPNVTSLGTLTSLTVTGTATAGNLSTGGTLSVTGNANVGNLGTGGLITATGNVTGGNLTTAGALSVTGNANVGNIGAASGIFTTVQGTLSTAAQPNITSVGTLSSLSVTGNVTAGNVSATDVSGTTLGGTLTTAAQPNITSVGTLTSLSVTGNVAAGNLTTTGILSVTGTGVSSIAGNLDMTSNNIINLADPVGAQDAATKAYVDNLASTGIHYHTPVRVEAPVALTATYNNGTAGVGATLTNSGANAALVIDGISLNVADRVLIYQQTDQTTNGVYVVTTVGDGSTAWVLTRSSDADTYAPSTSTGLDEGSYFYVQEGNTGAGESYVCNTPGTITFGTTNITFAQFSASQVYQAGTGLTLTNTTFSVNASQTQITSVGTLTGLNVNGNITAANITANTGVFTGNGSGLSAIAGGNVTGQVANALVAGTVYTAAQPNITSVGTLTSLAVTGNASAGNISTGGTLSVTGNANVGNIGATNGVFTSVSGNGSALTALNGSNISTGTIAAARVATLNQNTTGYAATVSTNAQPNITSVGTLTSLAVTGNVSAGNIVCTGVIGGAGADLTGNVLTTGSNSTAGVITGDWTLSAGSTLNSTYADLAEKYVADAEYEPGTVLLFGGDHEVTVSHELDSHRVAGVVSTNPAYTMNQNCDAEFTAVVALQGRVPCKVHGPVNKGDLMVSGANGHAIANNMARAGTIVGKALQNFEGSSGVIEVAVGRL